MSPHGVRSTLANILLHRFSLTGVLVSLHCRNLLRETASEFFDAINQPTETRRMVCFPLRSHPPGAVRLQDSGMDRPANWLQIPGYLQSSDAGRWDRKDEPSRDGRAQPKTIVLDLTHPHCDLRWVELVD